MVVRLPAVRGWDGRIGSRSPLWLSKWNVCWPLLAWPRFWWKALTMQMTVALRTEHQLSCLRSSHAGLRREEAGKKVAPAVAQVNAVLRILT